MEQGTNPLLVEVTTKEEIQDDISAAVALVSHSIDQLSTGREITEAAENGVQLLLQAIDQAQQLLTQR